MTETAAIDNQQTEIFELQVKNLRDYVDFHERMNDTKFDKIEALMARNLAKQEELIGELRSEFKNMDARMSRMEQRIDRLQGDMSDVKGDIKVINAKSALQSRLTRDATCIGIILGIALAVIQHFLK